VFTVKFVHEASRWKNQENFISFVVWFFQVTFTSLIFTNVLFVSDMFGSFRNVAKTGLSSVLTRSIHSVPKKRFYKNVSVVQNNSKFEINLGRNQEIWSGIYISLVNWTEELYPVFWFEHLKFKDIFFKYIKKICSFLIMKYVIFLSFSTILRIC